MSIIPLNLAILIGRGSRLPAILKNLNGYGKITVKTVISHKKEAPGIESAKSRGLETFYFRLTDWYREKTGKSGQELNQEEKMALRREYMSKLAKMLKEREIDFILMTGWDLVLTNELIQEFPYKIINVHPSLLPAFPGENAWVQALQAKAKTTGVTVHFVIDEGVDSGPIIAQKAVEIDENETADSLREKLNKIEDEIVSQVLKHFAEGKVKKGNQSIDVERQ